MEKREKIAIAAFALGIIIMVGFLFKSIQKQDRYREIVFTSMSDMFIKNYPDTITVHFVDKTEPSSGDTSYLVFEKTVSDEVAFYGRVPISKQFEFTGAITKDTTILHPGVYSFEKIKIINVIQKPSRM